MTRDELAALRAERLPHLIAAWTLADRSRQIRALANSGPRAIATVEAFVVTAETGRASTPAPTVVIEDRHDPRIPDWATNLVDRLAELTAGQVEKAFRWMHPDGMRHMTVDLSHDGDVRRVVAHFNRPSDAQWWLDQVPDGWQILHSHVQDLRAFPGERVAAHATIAPVELPAVADAKAVFAAADIDIDPIDPTAGRG